MIKDIIYPILIFLLCAVFTILGLIITLYI
jgi:hypothetical protein